MFRVLKIAIPAFVVGFVLGNAFWYLVSPLWIDRVVSESLPEELNVTVIKQGTFRDADTTHRGKGRAEILKTSGGSHLLRFTEFEVTNGPDLKVWLIKADDPKSSDDVKSSEWLSLGPLKGNKGDQNYTIPKDANIDDYRSVVIWCKQFGVLFSPAPLTNSS